MRNKRVWIGLLGGISLLFLPHSATADDGSLRVADLQKSLASIEREEAVVAKTDNAGAKTLLAEVHKNIAITLAGAHDDPHAGHPHDVRTKGGPPNSAMIKAMHLHHAARHLKAAGHESHAKQAMQEAERLTREPKTKHVHKPRHPAPEIVHQRIAAAIIKLRKDLDRLRKEVDTMRNIFEKYHERHGKAMHIAKPAGGDLDDTLRKLERAQESLDRFYRSDTIQLHTEAVRRDGEAKRREMEQRQREMQKRMEKQRAESQKRMEAVRRDAETRRRAVDAKRREAEERAKADREKGGRRIPSDARVQIYKQQLKMLDAEISLYDSSTEHEPPALKRKRQQRQKMQAELDQIERQRKAAKTKATAAKRKMEEVKMSREIEAKKKRDADKKKKHDKRPKKDRR